MISSLLKNRGLRLQLLVGLLLVLGTFPEPSEGLKCYSCNDAGAEACKETKYCPDYCYSQRWKEGEGKEPTSSKGCATDGEARCFKKEFDSDCKVAKNKDGYRELNTIIRNCRGAARDGDEFSSMCVCNSDLCNTGSSGGHSTSVIITALLTVALYNYA